MTATHDDDWLLNRMGRIAGFATTRVEAFRRQCCLRCEAPIGDWPSPDLREWAISALCPGCYAEITVELE